MALAIAPRVEIVASAVVASETDINSLIVQIHCDGLRFSDSTKQQPPILQQPLHQQQTHHTPPHQQPQQTGVRSAGFNGPLHNEVLQLAELLVFLDRQLARFVRIPCEPNPTITESTHDTILFILSLPSPHLIPSMPMHHDFVMISMHHLAKINGVMTQKKEDADVQKTKTFDSMNRRGSVFSHIDHTEPFAAIEAVLTAWGSSVKSGGGTGVAMAWKFSPMVGGYAGVSIDNNGCIDGVTVLTCIRVRLCAGIALFDACGFNCPLSLVKAECDLGAICFVASSIILFWFCFWNALIFDTFHPVPFFCLIFRSRICSYANIWLRPCPSSPQYSFAIVGISCSFFKICTCST
jgi:hypothetical protein